MSYKVLDNSKNGSVIEFLKNELNNTNSKSNFNIVSAYFSIYAFNALKEEFKTNVAKVNIIIDDPKQVEKIKNIRRQRIFKIQDDNISLEDSLSQNKIAQDCYNWLKSSNIQIKTTAKSMRGKMYFIDKEKPQAVVGSSDFTTSGLGVAKSLEYELNTVIDDEDTITQLKQWFQHIWENDSEDVKKDILRRIKEVYKENSPEIVYLKTLYEIFADKLDDSTAENVEQNTKFTETVIWSKLYKFQKDAVNSIVNKLNNYNGCILADSVGLGKTFTALGVIQYFICNKKPNILVLAPKRLTNNWKKYERHNINNPYKDDRLAIVFKTHTDLTAQSGKDFDWGSFDLVVIDESHNFRTATKSKKDEEGNYIRVSRYDKLMNDVIKNGSRQPKVLLLTATPVNTSLHDLKSQIRLIALDNDAAFRSSLGISSLKNLIATANNKYREWAKLKNRKKEDLLERLDTNFFNMLDALTIARSRKQIQNYYSSDGITQKVPKRKNPLALYVDNLDTKNKFMSFEKLSEEIDEYKLSLYKPTKFLERNEEKYKRTSSSAMTQEAREGYLTGMMKIGFLKRLESSVGAFALSMKHILDKIDERLYQIEQSEQSKKNYSLVINNDTLVYMYDEDDDVDYSVGKNLVYDIRDLDIKAWKTALEEDKKQIKKIYEKTAEILNERDAKLLMLKDIIINKAKTNNPKILIFTSFSDTAEYIYDFLEKFVKNDLGLNIALVTGNVNKTTFGQNTYDEILENFSPKSKLDDYSRTSKNQIDILIGTDCISEGQNLQDCDMVINYDIHWNPVRLIQRFGRIDRIGSDNKEIQMVCFWPTKNLESFIKLQSRVEARMTLVDQTSVGDDNILQKQDSDSETSTQLTFRERQIRRLMNEQPIEDIEESENDLSLSDFSMEDFHADLREAMKFRSKELENMPVGINTVIPSNFVDSNGESQTVRAGVIFCLKQKNESTENERFNKLQPYYLVYIKNNGEVLYTYEKAKKILTLYRELCLGKTEPYMELCELFNKKLETQNGIEFYNKLLRISVDGLTQSYKKEVINALFTRGGIIPTANEQVKGVDDFELISWLIIDERK